MSSKQPIIRQLKWSSIVAKIVVFVIISFLLSLLHLSDPIFYGALIFFLLNIILKKIVPKYHRRGVKYFKEKKYDLAIKEFLKSYDFFTSYNWIDKYRSIIILSSSRISYSEMALINIAFCFSQTGNGDKSKEYYEKVLKQYPDSEIALSALNMIESFKN